MAECTRLESVHHRKVIAGSNPAFSAMDTGIKLKKVKKGIVLNNYISEAKKSGIDVEDSDFIYINSNTIVKSSTLKTYGYHINDVALTVNRSKDIELKKAFEVIQNSSPDNAANSWLTIIKKLGIKIGDFNVDILKQVLSTAAYFYLKNTLLKYGINIP